MMSTGMQVQAHNRPDLGGDVPGLPILVIDAELKIDAVKKRVVVRVGPHEQFADLKAVQRPAASCE